MKNGINVLLVDDHPMFLDGISSILSSVPEINIVGKASHGQEALDLMKQLDVDIVLTDINMPDIDGIELNKQIKLKHRKTKTLVLSTYSNSQVIGQLIKKGVDGYLLKIAEKEELIQAIRSIHSGEKYFAKEVKDMYLEKLFENNQSQNTVNPQLSKREKQILHYLTKELTAKEIAQELFISVHTVHTHKKNLMTKLNVKNSSGLVKYATERGFQDIEDSKGTSS